jgi:hypothetical protein
VASTGTGPFEQMLLDRRHALRADEPVAVGGGDVATDEETCPEGHIHAYRLKQAPDDAGRSAIIAAHLLISRLS